MTLDGKHVRQVWRLAEGTVDAYTSRVLVLQYWTPCLNDPGGFWTDVPQAASDWDETGPSDDS